jgi:alanine transaminase
VNYYLNEEDNWSIDLKSAEQSWKEAKQKGIDVKAFVVINPGNPTGQVLPLDKMKQVLQFCYDHKLILLADEVYQENIYESVPFTSFRQALETMPENIRKELMLISFFSVSKGFYGECGKRGGFFRMVNIGEEEKQQIYKLSSVNLCSNVVGQEVVELVVNRPKEGDESYPLFKKEKDQILGELKQKANIIRDALIKCEGITCNPAMGALYLFPKVDLPKKFVEECDKNGKNPDEEYCILMLEKSGVCVVPGNGFGQREGTHHFRIAFLPPLEQIKGVTDLIQKFHKEFMDKYRDN